jgi:hypothetical protein
VRNIGLPGNIFDCNLSVHFALTVTQKLRILNKNTNY